MAQRYSELGNQQANPNLQHYSDDEGSPVIPIADVSPRTAALQWAMPPTDDDSQHTLVASEESSQHTQLDDSQATQLPSDYVDRFADSNPDIPTRQRPRSPLLAAAPPAAEEAAPAPKRARMEANEPDLSLQMLVAIQANNDGMVARYLLDGVGINELHLFTAVDKPTILQTLIQFDTRSWRYRYRLLIDLAILSHHWESARILRGHYHDYSPADYIIHELITYDQIELFKQLDIDIRSLTPELQTEMLLKPIWEQVLSQTTGL